MNTLNALAAVAAQPQSLDPVGFGGIIGGCIVAIAGASLAKRKRRIGVSVMWLGIIGVLGGFLVMMHSFA